MAGTENLAIVSHICIGDLGAEEDNTILESLPNLKSLKIGNLVTRNIDELKSFLILADPKIIHGIEKIRIESIWLEHGLFVVVDLVSLVDLRTIGFNKAVRDSGEWAPPVVTLTRQAGSLRVQTFQPRR